MTATDTPGVTVIDRSRLRGAVEAAHLPTLLMSLFQLTGERKWLEDPYRPTPGRGIEEHRSGGFSDHVQARVRAAAVDAVTAWSAGAPISVPAPTGALFLEMAACLLGERLPAEYEPMMTRQMGFAGPGEDRRPVSDPERARQTGYSVGIIGAGISGLFVAIRLRELGIPYLMLERGDGVGGVWRRNRYPGAGVDTPSALYSFPFFPKDWSAHFARQSEVLDYLERLTDEYDLRRSIRFGAEVLSAGWDDEQQCWRLRVRDGGGRFDLAVSAVVSAVGLFKEPARPDIPGLGSFRGPVFHSAEWRDDVDVSGRRLAVIGTGASAMQVVPATADRVARLDVFQRSAQWIAPVPHYFDRISDDEHLLFNHVPFYRAWYRARLSWIWNDRIHRSLVMDPGWGHSDRSVNEVNDRHREFLTRSIETALAGRPDLVAKAVPAYPPYGKRILLDNGWYEALRKPAVHLVTDPIAEITPAGIRTVDGTVREVDVIALCTGFQTHRYLQPIEFRGRDGVRLHDVWGDDNPRAYLGTTTPGFPNLFFMYGPGTNAGGGSFLSLAELWFGSILTLLATLVETGSGSVEVRRAVHDDYNRRMDEANERMVWSHPGMSNYVRNGRGRVTVNMPWRFVDFWRMNVELDLDDYAFEPAKPTRRRQPDRTWPKEGGPCAGKAGDYTYLLESKGR